MELIITDVTRFHVPDKVCVAGIDERGKCIQPLDYFSLQECKKYNIFPGSVIEGVFSQRVNAHPPHTEDHDRENIRFLRYTSSSEFFNLLNKNAKDSIEEGFDVDLSQDRKCIPPKYAPKISIITIRVNPREITLLQSDFGNRPLKISFIDNKNKEYKFMPFSDKYMYDTLYVNDIYENIQKTNKMIWKQKYAFLRIGLGRIYSVRDRKGYWLQVNSMYTFPQWINGIRKHL